MAEKPSYKELEKSQMLHKEAQSVAQIGHWELDSPSGKSLWSEEVFHIFGLDPKKSEPSFSAHVNIIHDEDWDFLDHSIQELSTHGTPFDIEFRILRPDSEIRWMHAKGSAYKDEDGSIVRMFGTVQDITKRKQAEEVLRESEEKYRLLFESMAPGVVYHNAAGAIIDANLSAEHLLGLTLDQMQGRTSIDPRWKTIHEDGSDFPGETHPAMVSLEKRVAIKDVTMGIFNPAKKEYHWLNINSIPQFNPDEDKPFRVFTTFDNITKRKEIEAGLEKTRKELVVIKIAADEAHEFADNVINTVREPLIALDQDLRVVSVSRSFYNFFRVKPEETMGQLIYDLGNKQWDIPKLRELLETILPEKSSFDNYEVEHDFTTIGRRTMLLNARQIERAMGKERIILMAIEDITQRKETEEKLAASLNEKVVLLREIHHRVKNNMQVIISLLRMHGRRISDPHLGKVFAECRDRINAMSLIHESLYQSENLARIDFKIYLKKLCQNLRQAYGTKSKGIALTVEQCDVTLDMDQGIAIGMVITELISNAFKHAFPLGRGGTVSIYLSNLDEKHVELIIKDDGKGMPLKIDIMNSPSLGLQLAVAAVTRELGGRIELERDNGTRFIIHFKYKNK